MPNRWEAACADSLNGLIDLDHRGLAGRGDSGGAHSRGAGQKGQCAARSGLRVSYHWAADSLGSPCSSRASASALLLERTLLRPRDFDGYW